MLRRLLCKTKVRRIRNVKSVAVGVKAKHPSKTNTPGVCSSCGDSWPHQGGQQNCLAKDKICHNCGFTGHFAKVCRKPKQSHGVISSLRLAEPVYENDGNVNGERYGHENDDQYVF